MSLGPFYKKILKKRASQKPSELKALDKTICRVNTAVSKSLETLTSIKYLYKDSETNTESNNITPIVNTINSTRKFMFKTSKTKTISLKRITPINFSPEFFKNESKIIRKKSQYLKRYIKIPKNYELSPYRKFPNFIKNSYSRDVYLNRWNNN
jgi:hypothetical protein